MASSTTLQGPRDDNIVPLLHLTVFLCVAMSVMLFVEKVYMAIIVLVKLFRKRPGRHPERQYIWDPIRENDEILVQIPVFNEREVYQLSIGAASRVTWTSDRIIIQVLDDSTDSVIKERNNEEEVMEDENERNQEEEIRRTTEEKEDENERNQEEEIRRTTERRTTEEKEDENERNQEEEIRRTTEEKEDGNERNQEEEIRRTTEEKKRRKQGGDERKSQAKRRKKAEGRRKRGGDTLGERKSQAKRRKIAEVNQDDEGRKKRKQQCRWVRSCMAMGCAAIFTSALIYLCAASISEEETIYLVPT